MGILTSIVYWHWLVLALILVALEMLLPATYFLWMGVAAATIGVIMVFVPQLPFLIQIIIFLLISVGSLVLHKRYLKRNPLVSDSPRS